MNAARLLAATFVGITESGVVLALKSCLLDAPILNSCGGGECNKIDLAPHRFLAGLPISYVGLAWWSLMLAFACKGLLGLTPSQHRAALGLATLGGIASVGLNLYGAIFLNEVCPYCFGNGALAILALALLSLDSALYSSRGEVSGLLAAFAPVLPLALMIGAVAVRDLRDRSFERSQLARRARDFDSLPIDQLVPAGAISLGNRQARRTVVCFGDFECPACGALLRAVLPSLITQRTYRIIWRHVPLEGHENSFALACIFEEAAARGDVLNFLDYAARRNSGGSDLSVLAARLGIDLIKLKRAAHCPRYPARLRIESGGRFALNHGVQGTPELFLVGASESSGRFLGERELVLMLQRAARNLQGWRQG
jgi:uncharacterized membrane protein